MLHRLVELTEYTSRDLERELRRCGALASIGSVADCYDNSMAESFFATLETELFWARRSAWQQDPQNRGVHRTG